MELAGVVIAVLALAVSIGSVLFTKRSADETSALRTIESQRWQAERCPVLGVVIEEMNQGQWHRLWVTLESSEPLDSIRANILDDPEVWFADGQTGVQPDVGRLMKPCGVGSRLASAKLLGDLPLVTRPTACVSSLTKH